MILDYDIAKSITVGASDIIATEQGVAFSRFTYEQRRLYYNRTEACYLRSLSASGIKLSFKTDSTKLYLSIDVAPASSRKYFSVDIYSDDVCVGYIDNFETDSLSTFYTEENFQLGMFSKEFNLGTGMKDVTIYFPWSVSLVLKELSLDDASMVEPSRRSRKLLAFGDSITQGYDALRPSQTYVSRIAKLFDADEYNKGIGGEVFFSELSHTKENFSPDYITVAYGTNDWTHKTRDSLCEECRTFFENLRKNYPATQIFAITPTWRSDFDDIKNSMTFDRLTNLIAACTKGLNINVIYGLDLIPESTNLFADGFVHPNDKGFELYANNLYKKINEMRLNK